MSKDGRKSEQGSGAVVMQIKRRWLHSQKHQVRSNKSLVILFFTILVLIAACVAWNVHKKTTMKSNVAHVCSTTSNPSLKQVMASFVPGQRTQAYQMVQKIIKINNYNQDPNCLYLIVLYDFSVNATQDASTRLIQLQKVYDPKIGFDPTLHALNITSLQAELTMLEKVSAPKQ